MNTKYNFFGELETSTFSDASTLPVGFLDCRLHKSRQNGQFFVSLNDFCARNNENLSKIDLFSTKKVKISNENTIQKCIMIHDTLNFREYIQCINTKMIQLQYMYVFNHL